MATYSQTAKEARLKVLDMVFKAQSSHIGSNFSVIDILAVLFSKADHTKDKIILSAGWKAASFYYFLAEYGYIPKEDLETYCQEGSKYIGLTEPGINGVYFAGGSMGMGFPAAVGFALAKKIKGEEGKVYCIMSDGELNSGTTWEASLIAVQHKLGNLHVIVDKNGLQAMGDTKKILGAYFPQRSWNVRYIDGHDFEQIESEIISNTNSWPRLTQCETVKGKGVSFMEKDNRWHYLNLTKEDYDNAKQELEQ